ncbi:hypothetical protein [Dongia sp. agr-C8]
MAEMVGLSRGDRHRTGAVGGFVAALKVGLSRLTGSSRSNKLRLEEWPDYLLRDIGLDTTIRDQAEPRGKPTDFLMR